MTTKPFNCQHQQILIEDALFTEYDLSEISAEDFAKFLLAGGGLDAFCVKCQQSSVFRLEAAGYPSYDEKAKSIRRRGIVSVKARCSRHSDNDGNKCEGELHFCFYRNDDQLIKIGQYPSKADLDFGSLDPVFKRELDLKLRRELGSAIGGRSHGIGIGSFVYLRRIFESLIEEARVEARNNDSQWDDALFEKSRMPDKIKLLKQSLPSRLVKSATLYGILSKGIHELSEEECLKHFDLVQKAILMILKERHEEKDYKKIVDDLNVNASDMK
jgi:hypothetical protein